jgi:hypothetical protein
MILKLGYRLFLVLGLMIFAGCSSKDSAVPQDTGSQAASKSPFEGLLVRRSGSTLEDQKVYVVQNGQKRWVTSAAWMRDHGYRWPKDVRYISAEQLDSIPLGEPITK